MWLRVYMWSHIKHRLVYRFTTIPEITKEHNMISFHLEMAGSFIIPQLCAAVVTMWSWRDSESTAKDRGGNLCISSPKQKSKNFVHLLQLLWDITWWVWGEQGQHLANGCCKVAPWATLMWVGGSIKLRSCFAAQRATPALLRIWPKLLCLGSRTPGISSSVPGSGFRENLYRALQRGLSAEETDHSSGPWLS